MQIQLSTEFALHGLLYLAHHQDRQPVQLAEIAAATKVKESYLRKLFQSMVKAGILDAYKGSSGGYSLKSCPEQVTLYDVLKAVEGEPGFQRCYAGQRSCGLHLNCPVIHGFDQAFESFTLSLKGFTLAKILSDTGMQSDRAAWIESTAVSE